MIEYIVGAYAHINDYELLQTTVLKFGPFNGSSTRSFDQENTALSGFGSITFNATDSLRLLGSLRYTYDKKTADQQRAITGVVIPSFLATPFEWAPD